MSQEDQPKLNSKILTLKKANKQQQQQIYNMMYMVNKITAKGIDQGITQYSMHSLGSVQQYHKKEGDI